MKYVISLDMNIPVHTVLTNGKDGPHSITYTSMKVSMKRKCFCQGRCNSVHCDHFIVCIITYHRRVGLHGSSTNNEGCSHVLENLGG